MSDKRIARGSIFIFTNRIIVLFLRALVLLFMARILGPSEYGKFSTVFAFCVIIQVLFESGFPGSTIKAISSEEGKVYSTAKFSLTLQTLLAVCVFIVIFVFSPFISRHIFGDASFSSYLKVAVLYFVPTAIYAIGYSILVAKRKFDLSALLGFFWSASRALLILLFLFSFKNVYAIFYAIFISSLIGLIPVGTIFSKIKKKVSRINKRKIIMVALSIFISAVAMRAVVHIDKIFVKKFLQDNAIVGRYALASNISLVLQIFVGSLMITLFPSVSGSFAKSDFQELRKYLNEGTRYMLLVLIPVSCFLAIIGRDFMGFFFGSNFIPASVPFSVLIFSSSIYSFFFLYRHLLISMDKYWVSTVMTLFVLGIAFILNPVLILRYGFMGAAWATFTASSIGAIITGFYIYRISGARYPLVTFIKIFAASLVCAILALLAGGYAPFVRYAIYSSLFIAFIAFMNYSNVFTKKDIDFIKSSFMRK